MHVCTPDEMREIEARVDASGHSYDDMMALAGAAVAAAVRDRGHKPSVVALCGPGNNGGDGLVAAAALARDGSDVKALLWRRDPGDLPAPVDRDAFALVEVARDTGDGWPERLAAWLAKADVIVDALLGTGGGRAIESPLADILRIALEAAEEPGGPIVVAVDAPTGLNLADGTVDPAILPADVTVTFGFPKVGQLTFPGAAYIGDLIVDDIGMPDDLATGTLHMATAEDVAATLPVRPISGHKGTFGKALVAAGSVNYTGAAFLAAAAAYRVGAGLVTAAIPASLHPIIAGLVPEATFLLLPEDLGVVSRAAAELIADAAVNYDALLLGPGLTDQRPAAEFLHDLLRDGLGHPHHHTEAIGFESLRSRPASAEGDDAGGDSHAENAENRVRQGETDGDSDRRPSDRGAGDRSGGRPTMVVDADGLNILASKFAPASDAASVDAALGLLPPETVLTPHPGEMARLTGRTAAEINADRVGAARDAAAQWGHILVLKGALTVVAAPDGRATIVPHANPALATAGTGDVLSGAIAGLLAQGMAPFDAAVAGAYLHAVAGEMAGEAMGQRGTTAGDVLRHLAWAVAEIEGDESDRPTAC